MLSCSCIGQLYTSRLLLSGILGLAGKDVLYTVELQWLEHLRERKISSRQGYFEPMGVDYSARSGGLIGTC